MASPPVGQGGVGRIGPAGRRGRRSIALRREIDLVPYFTAYGTTQQGSANHRRYSELLGERVARVRTASGHAVVVPYRAACSNPGCPYRTGWRRWWPASSTLRVEGDLFLITASALQP